MRIGLFAGSDDGNHRASASGVCSGAAFYFGNHEGRIGQKTGDRDRGQGTRDTGHGTRDKDGDPLSPVPCPLSYFFSPTSLASTTFAMPPAPSPARTTNLVDAARLLGTIGRGTARDPGGTLRAMKRRLGYRG